MEKPVIYIFCDTTMTAPERAVVSRAAKDAEVLFPMCRVEESCAGEDPQGERPRRDGLFDGTKNEHGRYDASLVLRKLEQAQGEFPRAAAVVLFTARDLFASSTKNAWCFGLANSRTHVSVQSVCRYRKLSEEDRLLCVRRTLRHELGHAFGMAMDRRRAHTEVHFGLHCTNPGCTMRQSGTLTELLVLAREEDSAGTYFCAECREDLRRRMLRN